MDDKENFEIKLRIKDEDGKIISLKEKVDLKVKGEKVEVPQEVVFKKDGKEYRIIITKLEILKGWLEKKAGSFNWKVPPNASYQIYHGETNPGPEPKLLRGNDKSDYYIKITSPWRTEVITTLLIIFIIITVILFLWDWKKNKE